MNKALKTNTEPYLYRDSAAEFILFFGVGYIYIYYLSYLIYLGGVTSLENKDITGFLLGLMVRFIGTYGAIYWDLWCENKMWIT